MKGESITGVQWVLVGQWGPEEFTELVNSEHAVLVIRNGDAEVCRQPLRSVPMPLLFSEGQEESWLDFTKAPIPLGEAVFEHPAWARPVVRLGLAT